jgi:hypothetical protein
MLLVESRAGTGFKSGAMSATAAASGFVRFWGGGVFLVFAHNTFKTHISKIKDNMPFSNAYHSSPGKPP